MNKCHAAGRAIAAIKTNNEAAYVDAMRDLYALLSDDERNADISRMESALAARKTAH